MNGYLVSTDPPESNDEAEIPVDALIEMMADVGIANHGSLEDITQDEHIYKASIFEILRPSKPGSQPESLVTSPDVSTPNKTKHSPREYSPKAHLPTFFKERAVPRSGTFYM